MIYELDVFLGDGKSLNIITPEFNLIERAIRKYDMETVDMELTIIMRNRKEIDNWLKEQKNDSEHKE